jgi:hypothetical protein
VIEEKLKGLLRREIELTLHQGKEQKLEQL